MPQSFTRGLPTGIDGFAPSIRYHPNGTVHQVRHANGVDWVQWADPNDMQRPSRIHTSGASDELDTGLYDYDGAGNVTRTGADRYAYDRHSRISEARLGAFPEACSGDLVLSSRTETSPVTHEACGRIDAGPAYTVESDVRLRAEDAVVLHDGVTVAEGGSLVVESGTPVNDAPESLVQRTQSYLFDRFGNLTERTTDEGTLDEERTLALDWSDGSDFSLWHETYTLRGLDGSPLRQYRVDGGNAQGNWSLYRDYVWRDGTLLASIRNSTSNFFPEAVYFLHPDHLGSPRLITNEDGGTVRQIVYFPFGQEATTPSETELLKYTGHERDFFQDGQGGTPEDLDYMHARYYSAHLGRFMSVDPSGAAARTLPQSWNRYAFNLNNPLRLVDPDGESPILIIAAAGIVGGLLLGAEPANAPAPGDRVVPNSMGDRALGGAVAGVTVASLLRRSALPTPSSTGQSQEQPCAGPCGSDPSRRRGVAPGKDEPKPQAVPGQRAKEKGRPSLRPADRKDKMQPPMEEELLQEAEKQMQKKPERSIIELAFRLIGGLFGGDEPPPE